MITYKQLFRINGLGAGLSCLPPTQEEGTSPYNQTRSEMGGYKMEAEYKLKTLLKDVDREFLGLNHYQRAKLAIEQISMWQERFNEAKGKILKENIVEGFSKNGMISQYPEIEA